MNGNSAIVQISRSALEQKADHLINVTSILPPRGINYYYYRYCSISGLYSAASIQRRREYSE